MSVAAREGTRLPRRWMKRIRGAVVVYLVVGFLTSLVGFNLLGAVFFSGPLFGRVVDSNGHGIRGAFVAYEWRGRSFHGSTGCQAAAIVRSGGGGFYVVPWQGWRLFHAMGWGISPLGPAIWAPGHIPMRSGKGNTVFMPVQEQRMDLDEAYGIVDKLDCFGWPYRGARMELKATEFRDYYDKVCVARVTLDVDHLKRLYGLMLGAVSANEGEVYSAQSRSLSRRYQVEIEKIAWSKGPPASDVTVSPEQRDGFCSKVKSDYLASGGQFE